MISRHKRAMSQNPDKAGKRLVIKRVIKAGVMTRKKKQIPEEPIDQPVKQPKSKITRKRRGRKIPH